MGIGKVKKQIKYETVEHKTFFVIKKLSNNNYLSFEDLFNVVDDFNLCKEFDSEESALKELEKLNGYFVIEKVYNL